MLVSSFRPVQYREVWSRSGVAWFLQHFPDIHYDTGKYLVLCSRYSVPEGMFLPRNTIAEVLFLNMNVPQRCTMRRNIDCIINIAAPPTDLITNRRPWVLFSYGVHIHS